MSEENPVRDWFVVDHTCGLPYQFKGDADALQNKKCIKCNRVARDPLQLACQSGAIVCYFPLNKRGSSICPKCDNPRCQSFKDLRLQEEIALLAVYCNHHEAGCKWEGTVAEIEDHMTHDCEYMPMQCERCGHEVRRREIGDHNANKCPLREYQCQLCNEIGTHAFITSQQHLQKCPMADVICPNLGCTETLKRRDMPRHEADCPKRMVKCERCGQEVRYHEIGDHDANECPLREHQCQLCNEVGTHAFIASHEHQEKCPMIEVKCPNFGCNEALKRRDLPQHDVDCSKQIVKCERCGKEASRREIGEHNADECPLREHQCQLCSETGTHAFITSQEHQEQCSMADVHCPNHGCIEVLKRRDLPQHQEDCPKRIVRCSYHTIGCKEELTMRELHAHKIDKASVHLEMMFDKQKSKSVKLTKALNYIQKRKTWYSEGFYPVPEGCQVRLCVSPTSDAASGVQYLSVRINIMPGDNDDNLDWPVKVVFKVMMLNQMENRNHRSEKIVFDERIPVECTRRRTKKDEHSYGIDRFIDIASLETDAEQRIQYRRNDAIYFKVFAEYRSEIRPWLT